MAEKIKGYTFVYRGNGYVRDTLIEAEAKIRELVGRDGGEWNTPFNPSLIQYAEVEYEDGHLLSYTPLDGKKAIIWSPVVKSQLEVFNGPT